MKKSLLTAGVLSALLLAACGGQAEKSAEQAPAATSTAPDGSGKADVKEREHIMKAFKINTEAQQVEEIQINTWKDIAPAIGNGCRCFNKCCRSCINCMGY